MARVLTLNGRAPTPLADGWEMALASDDAAGPDEIAGLDWIAAPVPGTAAQAIESAGKNAPELMAGLQRKTVWYRLPLPAGGERVLTLHGLATLCTIWLDDQVIGTTDNMFLPYRFDLKEKARSTLYLQFYPLEPSGLTPRRRQRWRPHLVASPHLRLARSSLLGHMPGWCPAVPPVGPWRAVTIEDADAPSVTLHRLHTTVDGTTGTLEIECDINGIDEPLRLRCAGREALLMPGGGGRMATSLSLPGIPLWWPHTHGEPNLHDIEIKGKTTTIDLGKVGFRTLALDRGADGKGFALVVNGTRIFCRGANWTNADLVSLPGTKEAYRPLLERARDAGMNMLRVPGVMALETPEFTELLDELGILHWQDMMLANFDYGFGESSADAPFKAELAAFLAARQGAPSLAVVCGGSEMAQQAAMLSLPEAVWNDPFLKETFPALVAAERPDVIAVPNSPWGGDLPFSTGAGVTHYYGVGAYRRPLEDARRANVRFASECLAFATLPQPEAMPTGAAPTSAEWKALVVRDLKADWDFEDVRDHYTDLLYSVDCSRLKQDDPARYRALAAATPGEVMETVMAEFRRAGAPTAGALVWHLSDLGPGFGWGVIDHQTRPKPPYYALARAFRPVSVAITDEGLDGLALHLINETATPRALTVTLTAYAEDGTVVIDGILTKPLPPRTVEPVSSAEVFGVFFDVTDAYRFGPPAHAVTVARLTDTETGERIAEAFHFPRGRAAVMADAGLTATAGRDDHGAYIDLVTQRLAQSVHLDLPGFEPEDDWFHLAPGMRRIRLKGAGAPRGQVTALNMPAPARVGAV